MKLTTEISGYRYQGAELNSSHDYLVPDLCRTLRGLHKPAAKVFDLGCGNGSVSRVIASMGHDVTGVDPSPEGIAQANRQYPELKLTIGSAYDDLAAQFGKFDVVVSLEVVEHLYDPRHYARTIFDLLEGSGIAIISTPYHSYLKNLALAASGSMDRHFTALWDHGHIKFWSMKTLSTLLSEAGFENIRFRRVGRIPILAKSMIAIANRPAQFSKAS